MDYGRPMRAVKASLAIPLGEMRNREGPRRLYAETAGHTHRDVQASDALADGTSLARLTVKTVDDLESSSNLFLSLSLIHPFCQKTQQANVF